MVFSLTTAISHLDPEKQVEVKACIYKIHEFQRSKNMEPRDDSLLTFRYAIGEVDQDASPEGIANELVIVDKIYKTTRYPHIIEDVFREIAHHIKLKYKLPWDDTWEIVQFYGPGLLKLYCLRCEQNV